MPTPNKTEKKSPIEKEELYCEFIYESRWTGLAFIVAGYFFFATLYALFSKLYDFGWIMFIFGFMLLLPWGIIYLFPQIDTYKGYAQISEKGVEISSKFKKYSIEWKSIQNISFIPYSAGGKNRGLHITIRDSSSSIDFLLSRTDKKQQSLYSFYEALHKKYITFIEEESIKTHLEMKTANKKSYYSIIL